MNISAISKGLAVDRICTYRLRILYGFIDIDVWTMNYVVDGFCEIHAHPFNVIVWRNWFFLRENSTYSRDKHMSYEPFSSEVFFTLGRALRINHSIKIRDSGIGEAKLRNCRNHIPRVIFHSSVSTEKWRCEFWEQLVHFFEDGEIIATRRS